MHFLSQLPNTVILLKQITICFSALKIQSKLSEHVHIILINHINSVFKGYCYILPVIQRNY